VLLRRFLHADLPDFTVPFTSFPLKSWECSSKGGCQVPHPTAFTVFGLPFPVPFPVKVSKLICRVALQNPLLPSFLLRRIWSTFSRAELISSCEDGFPSSRPIQLGTHLSRYSIRKIDLGLRHWVPPFFLLCFFLTLTISAPVSVLPFI